MLVFLDIEGSTKGRDKRKGTAGIGGKAGTEREKRSKEGNNKEKRNRYIYTEKQAIYSSIGFRIWKEHIRVSSTLIMAPALSNSPQ